MFFLSPSSLITLLLSVGAVLTFVPQPAFALPNPEIKRAVMRPRRAVLVLKIPKRAFRSPRSRIILQGAVGSNPFGVFKDKSLKRLRARRRPVRRRTIVRLRHRIGDLGLYRYRTRAKRRAQISEWSPVVSALALPGSSSSAPPHDSQQLGASCEPGFQAAVLDITNQIRSDHGLEHLDHDHLLAQAAELHNLEMINNQLLSHDGWLNPIFQLEVEGTNFGQNIASYFSSPQAVMNAWMQSPGHRTQILSSSYSSLGVSCLVDVEGIRWWTQNFSN